MVAAAAHLFYFNLIVFILLSDLNDALLAPGGRHLISYTGTSHDKYKPFGISALIAPGPIQDDGLQMQPSSPPLVPSGRYAHGPVPLQSQHYTTSQDIISSHNCVRQEMLGYEPKLSEVRT